MISSIIQLPKELFHDKVVTLLDVVDLVCFDSALLNHQLRPQMHDLINGGSLNTNSIIFDEHSVAWFYKRNICVSSLCIDRALNDLKMMKQLARSVKSRLSFDNCNMLTTEAIIDFLQYCENINSLSVKNVCKGEMEGNVLESIATLCPKIHTIDVSMCTLISANNIAALTTGCKRLIDIDITCCSINFETIQTIVLNCPQLRRLVADFTDFDDSCMKVVAKHCHDLRHLSVNSYSNLTDEGLVALSACSELRAFHYDCNEYITSRGIITLAVNCTQLEEITLPDCDEEVNFAVAALVKYCPALKVLHCDSSDITEHCKICDFVHFYTHSVLQTLTLAPPL